MNLKQWLSGERGRAAALAARLGVSRGRVSQMADEGVSKTHLLAVRDFTNGDVTLEELLLPSSTSTPPIACAEVAHGPS